MQRTFFLATLGCKVNWCDSDRIVARAHAAGWRRVAAPQDAVLCLVNTCTVTGHADATARKIIRQVRRENPGAAVMALGCLVRANAQALDTVRGVDALVPGADEAGILARMEQEFLRLADRTDAATCAGETEPASVQRRAAARTRAFVKVHDGCNQYCAYCIVPYARGGPRSVPMAAVLEEIRRRAEEGHREVVLAGVHLSAYDDNGTRLPELLRAVAALRAIPRVRLSSVEANAVNEALLAAFAECPELMPHLHMPLQSGSNRVLALMNRTIRVEQFLDTVRAFARACPQATVTTDVMVGFPGETEADFEDTLAAVRAAGFAKTHVFPFSPRPGTAAAGMTRDFVPVRVVREREQRLLGVAHEMALHCRARFADRPLSVLIEGRKAGRFEGFSENYLRIRTMRPDIKTNDIVTLAVDGVDNEFAPVT